MGKKLDFLCKFILGSRILRYRKGKEGYLGSFLWHNNLSRRDRIYSINRLMDMSHLGSKLRQSSTHKDSKLDWFYKYRKDSIPCLCRKRKSLDYLSSHSQDSILKKDRISSVMGWF